MNLDLFSSDNEGQTIDIPDGNLFIYPNFYDAVEADKYFQQLLQTISWRQEKISMYGKTHNVPRLSAWYGDEGKIYQYSGIRTEAIQWTALLLAIKEKIETVSDYKFNSVLVNQYRNGKDGVAWHSDDEPELGKNPVIASLSFGEERLFQLKHKRNKNLKKSFTLPHGSLLVMGENTQLNWLHQLPKSQRSMEPRINLTFRLVNSLV